MEFDVEPPEEWRWSDRLSDIRARIEERTPEYWAGSTT